MASPRPAEHSAAGRPFPQKEIIMAIAPVDPTPKNPPGIVPDPTPGLPEPPIQEPDPDVLPDELPNPNPDENDDLPKRL